MASCRDEFLPSIDQEFSAWIDRSKEESARRCRSSFATLKVKYERLTQEGLGTTCEINLNDLSVHNDDGYLQKMKKQEFAFSTSYCMPLPERLTIRRMQQTVRIKKRGKKQSLKEAKLKKSGILRKSKISRNEDKTSLKKNNCKNLDNNYDSIKCSTNTGESSHKFADSSSKQLISKGDYKKSKKVRESNIGDLSCTKTKLVNYSDSSTNLSDSESVVCNTNSDQLLMCTANSLSTHKKNNSSKKVGFSRSIDLSDSDQLKISEMNDNSIIYNGSYKDSHSSVNLLDSEENFFNTDNDRILMPTANDLSAHKVCNRSPKKVRFSRLVDVAEYQDKNILIKKRMNSRTNELLSSKTRNDVIYSLPNRTLNGNNSKPLRKVVGDFVFHSSHDSKINETSECQLKKMNASEQSQLIGSVVDLNVNRNQSDSFKTSIDDDAFDPFLKNLENNIAEKKINHKICERTALKTSVGTKCLADDSSNLFSKHAERKKNLKGSKIRRKRRSQVELLLNDLHGERALQVTPTKDSVLENLNDDLFEKNINHSASERTKLNTSNLDLSVNGSQSHSFKTSIDDNACNPFLKNLENNIAERKINHKTCERTALKTSIQAKCLADDLSNLFSILSEREKNLRASKIRHKKRSEAECLSDDLQGEWTLLVIPVKDSVLENLNDDLFETNINHSASDRTKLNTSNLEECCGRNVNHSTTKRTKLNMLNLDKCSEKNINHSITEQTKLNTLNWSRCSENNINHSTPEKTKLNISNWGDCSKRNLNHLNPERAKLSASNQPRNSVISAINDSVLTKNNIRTERKSSSGKRKRSDLNQLKSAKRNHVESDNAFSKSENNSKMNNSTSKKIKYKTQKKYSPSIECCDLCSPMSMNLNNIDKLFSSPKLQSPINMMNCLGRKPLNKVEKDDLFTVETPCKKLLNAHAHKKVLKYSSEEE